MQEPVGLLKTGSETAEADGHDGDLPELFKSPFFPWEEQYWPVSVYELQQAPLGGVRPPLFF
jgi:hypothetical protein